MNRAFGDKSMETLPEKLHEKIEELCAKGDDLCEMGKYADALKQYWKAWDVLPAPKTNWNAATWILVAVGDTNFLSGDYTAGRDNLSTAMHCPEAVGNPCCGLIKTDTKLSVILTKPKKHRRYSANPVNWHGV